MSSIVDEFITGLKHKNDDVKSKKAREFKNSIVNDLKDKSHEEMIQIVDSIFSQFLRMINNDIQDKKAVLIGICSIADMDVIFSHNKFFTLRKQIIDMPIVEDIQINALKARFIALLNLISTNDLVESQIKESCNVIEDDSKLESHKIYAAMTFKENSLYASTVFFQHAPKIIASLLIGIRDKHPGVREACGQALAYSFSVIATREGIGRRRSKVKQQLTSTDLTGLSRYTSGKSHLENSVSIPDSITNQSTFTSITSASLLNPKPQNNTNTSNTSGTTNITSFPEYFQWEENLYGECVKNIIASAEDFNFKATINNRKLNMDAINHGNLLLLIELLKLSNHEMESNLLKLEEMIGLRLDQLMSSVHPSLAQVDALRSLSHQTLWPMSNTEQHVLQHRSKIYHSHSCKMLMLKEIDRIWKIVQSNFDSKQQYLIQLAMLTLPRLIALQPHPQYSKFTLDWLQRCIKKDKKQPLVFITLGLIAHIVPRDFQDSGHLDLAITIIKDNMPKKDLPVKKRLPMVDMSIYMLIGLIATGCRENVHDQIKEMIQAMVDAGLSFPLIFSLKMVAGFINSLTMDIHTTLLKCLRKILMYTHTKNAQYLQQQSSQQLNQSHMIGGAGGMGTNNFSLLQLETLDLNTTTSAISPHFTSVLLAPIAPANITPEQSEARNKILALRTLVEFDFDKHSLSVFVRNISSKLISFVNCPYKELRIEAVKTCAQLLTPLLGTSDESIIVSSSDRNTLNAVADVLEKLLIVSTSDPEPEVRLCVFQSFDEKFDAYLAQECHLSCLFIALYDECFEIRQLVIRCLGRLSAINPSCLKPNLRKILLQTLNELEHSGSSRCKEESARLLSELIDTAPGFIQPHSEQLLLVLLPRIQSIINSALRQHNDNDNTMTLGPSTAGVNVSREVTNRSISSPANIIIGEGLFASNQLPGYPAIGTSPVLPAHIEEPATVQLAVMEAIKNLSVVCGSKLRRYLDSLVPALIYMMQDSTTLQRRHIAVSTLCSLITHTGYVVQPYQRHPHLLRILLSMLQTEEVGSIRREVIKLLGTIGALDPFKLKLFTTGIDSAGDTGLVVSMHDVVDKKEVDMTQAELLVNIPWASMDDFYIACTLQSLIQLLREPSFRTYFDKICQSIMVIFKSLGAKSVQYLRQILPEYFRCITEAPDNRQQEILLGQICLITDVVKLHLKQFMPQLVDILVQLWTKSPPLTKICIEVLHKLNKALGAEIKPFINKLIVVFQCTLLPDNTTANINSSGNGNNCATSSNSSSHVSVLKLLGLLPEFGYAIEQCYHIIVPSIIKLISSPREDTSSTNLSSPNVQSANTQSGLSATSNNPYKLELKKAALDCLTRLTEKLDLSNMAGRIVQAVCRLLYRHDVGLNATNQSPSTMSYQRDLLNFEQLSELVPHAFDLLTTLLVKIRGQFIVLSPLTQKTIESIKNLFPAGSYQAKSIIRFNNILNRVVKVYYLASYHNHYFYQDDNGGDGGNSANDDNFQDYESFANRARRRLDQSTSSAVIAVGNTAIAASTTTPPATVSESTDVVMLDGSGSSGPVKFNSVLLESAWSHCDNLVSTEDWLQWLRNFSHALLKQSPCEAIRCCANVIGSCTAATPTLGRQLFNVAFVSCWLQLTDTQQDKLVITLERVLNHDCANTEVTQTILNLEEFMSRCERMKLPISTRVLANRSLVNRVYAKALYYREQEFLEEKAKKGKVPENTLFELLNINHKLQLEEAAKGVVIYAQKNNEKLETEEKWHERLGDWTKALNLYERNLEKPENQRVTRNELILGRMRCLQALGDWNALRTIGIERYDAMNNQSYQQQQQLQHRLDDSVFISIGPGTSLPMDYHVKMAPILVNAAWALGDFTSMLRFVEVMPISGSFEGPFFRAVIAVHIENFHEAADFIQKARDELDSYLTAMAGESYVRAYNDLVQAQKLAELEEVMQYKLVRESQATIRKAWTERLAGCHQNIDDWRQLLQIRALVLTPQQDAPSWLKMAGLARRSGRMDLARTIIDALRAGSTTNVDPRVEFALAKYQWANNQTREAIERLQTLVEEEIKRQHQQDSQYVHQPQQQQYASRLLYAKCCLRLGLWYSEKQYSTNTASNIAQDHHQHHSNPMDNYQSPCLDYRGQSNIIAVYRMATEEAPWLPRAWQAWAMANYVSICRAKSSLVELNKQMNQLAKKWYASYGTTAAAMQSSSPITLQQQHSFNNASASNHNNNSNHQLPAEVLRMAQPQLRFMLLQTHHKKGYNHVSFPSMSLHIPDSLATFGQAAAVRSNSNLNQPQLSPNENLQINQPITVTSSSISNNSGNMGGVNSAVATNEDQDRLAEAYIQLEQYRQRLIKFRDLHSHPAVRGFVNSIALSPQSNLQDSLRLVILLFQFGNSAKIREVIRDGLSKIRLENWLLVIQQLLARIDTQKEHVASIIVGLLISVGERHPQAMINPLVLSFKSGGSDRRRYNANKILHSMETHSAKLVQEGFLLNEELIRLAISWMEMWTECLEDASRLFYEDKNVVAMFKILHPLHLLMERKVETLQESVFFNEYAQDLFAAKNLCVRYESSNYRTDLTQAWEIYSNLYRKWSKHISNFSVIELSVASPRLHDYRGWTLAVPGSYQPNRVGGDVCITSVRNCLQMMTSKQHPRKLTLLGSDGHSYMFLLKGHEDIRQDERAMQFFGLINTLLVTNPATFRRNLSIQRMSVIPLSTNTGLIGWVPNSDTLNALIREYREKTAVLLNREHKEMLKLAPDFEKLNIIQKTEVFEAGIRESEGKDLAHILWLKSHNSEIWFERRTNFIRSLAVMSMVGYILGLGDRHPSNIMLCRESGKVIHIDFGDCFEVATLREKYPEKVPFRLTRMLIGAMEVTGLDGVFRQTCIQLVKLMRRNKESLLAVLEAFIHDPLLQWVQHDNNNINNNHNSNNTGDLEILAVNELRAKLNLHPQYPTQPSTQKQQAQRSNNHQQPNQMSTNNTNTSSNLLNDPIVASIRIFTDPNYPNSKTLRNPFSVNQWRHHLCNGPWLGSYNAAMAMRKRMPDGSILVERNGLEGLIFSAKPANLNDNSISEDFEDDDWAGANIRAMNVMNHIQDKLEGKESTPITSGCLNAEQHVDMLIKQATSNYNLCQMYFGWCAFW